MAESGRKRLAGKVAIVSGSGRGIGRCEAMLLADQGAKVVVNDIGKDPDGKRRADKVVEEIRAAGGEAVVSTDSISTLEGANRTVQTAVKSFGGLDILVNNAGLRAPTAIDELTEEQWNLVIDSHLKGTYALIKFAVPVFRDQHSGVIINTGSESGLGHPFNSAYAAAKEGIAGLTRSLARELGRFGIRCNMIRPRAATPGGPEFMEMYQKWMPIARALGPYWLGERAHVRTGEMNPERVAALVVWLCTDAAINVNGRGFYVAGEEVGLWSEPELVRCMTRPGGWDLDTLDESGPDSLIIDLTNKFLIKDPEEKDLAPMDPTPDFDATLREHALGTLQRGAPTTLQINVGKLCNQACHHCHVDAGPGRKEQMVRSAAQRCLEVLAASPGIATVDLTGGAPELNANFRYLVAGARAMGRHVMVRCNLTVLFVPGMNWLPQFYRDAQAELVCSLPCYGPDNVAQQRGKGVFEQSIEALRLLNRLGYGRQPLTLDLVYNPVGAFLPPAQAQLEERYRQELGVFGVEFNRLLTITNMPIKRFARQLRQWGKDAEYMSLLVNHFNPGAVASLMCRNLVSVGYEGTLYDCDFNQMLELPLRVDGMPLTIWEVNDLSALKHAQIVTGPHCFGCTAGAGSSCGGALT